MMELGDPVEVMLAHSRWATGNVLDACAGLSEKQFHERFEIGPGSLHDTLTHIIGSIRRYVDVLAKQPMRDRLDAKRRTVEELRRLHTEFMSEFERLARSRPLTETVTLTQGGKNHAVTRGGVVTHVALHSMHHRAQCLNMLRQLGVTPLPMTGCMQWMISEQPAK